MSFGGLELAFATQRLGGEHEGHEGTEKVTKCELNGPELAILSPARYSFVPQINCSVTSSVSFVASVFASPAVANCPKKCETHCVSVT